MDDIDVFPARYRKNIRRIVRVLCTDAETAFSMMVMTAALSDLSPDDSRVVDYILTDCGIEQDISLCGAE